MKKEVLVLDPDEQQNRNLCDILTAYDYTAISMNSLVNVDQYIEESDCRTLILNLDKVAVTNKIFRALKTKKPRLNIIAGRFDSAVLGFTTKPVTFKLSLRYIILNDSVFLSHLWLTSTRCASSILPFEATREFSS